MPKVETINYLWLLYCFELLYLLKNYFMWFYIVSVFLIFASLVPMTKNTHWFSRIFEFGKIQILVFQLIVFVFGIFFIDDDTLLNYTIQIATLLCIAIHSKDLFVFTPLYKSVQKKQCAQSSQNIKVISVNVYQENSNYSAFKNLIHKYNPDIFLTMESDALWENELETLSNLYPFSIKVPLSNTYGIHLYSKLKILSHKVNYFVADDLPSIQATIKTDDGYVFDFFGVHPPPPSPTEETNSKERDGELLSIAKVIRTLQNPCVVLGDFNNVAWANSSKLFRKTSNLLDARLGRGFVATFHAKYWFLRFPIDLMYHSTDVFITKLTSLEYINSDHFPIYSEFFINKETTIQEQFVEDLETTKEAKEVMQIIQEGIEEESENRS